MPRVPALTRDELSPEGQAAYDHMMQGQSGNLPQTLTTMLHSPHLAACVSDLGKGFSAKSNLDIVVRNIVTFTVARELECKAAWKSHEQRALKVGIRQVVVDGINARNTKGMYPKESVFVDYAKQVMNRKVIDPTFMAIEHLLGRQGAVELTMLITFYMMFFTYTEAMGILPPPGMELTPPAA